jgi:pilus assembly protein CpaD
MPTQNPMTATRLLLLAGIVLIAGCTTDEPTEQGWSDPVPPKLSKVDFITLDHDVYFTRGARTIAAGEVAGLTHFLKDNGVADGDTVTVNSPAGARSLAAGRQAAVVAELRTLHVHAVPAAATGPQADAVRIHIGHAIVTAPRCPDWSKPEDDNPTNTPSSNFGCATEANLAQMVADPADLVSGKPVAATDGVVMARSVDLYRSGGLAKTLSGSGGYSTSGLSGTGGSGSGGGGGGGGQ